MPVPDIANIPGPSRPGWPSGSPDMEMVFRTTTANENIRIVGINLGNTNNALYYDYQVDWGDGTVESYQNDYDVNHNYVTPGDHNVKIIGQYAGFYPVSGNFSRTKLVEFKNWGDSIIRAFNYFFYGCTNMVYTAKDYPKWNGSMNLGLRDMFRQCTSITELDLSNWDSDMLSYAMDGGNSQGAFYNLNYCERLVLPDNINSGNCSTISTMFYGLGSGTADGAEIVFKNFTNNRSNLNISSLLHNSKLKFADFRNWTINSAGGTYWGYARYAVPGNYVDMRGWSTTGSGLTNFYFRQAQIEELRCDDWSEDLTRNITSWSHNMFSSKVKRIRGLQNFNFDSTTNGNNAMSSCPNLRFDSPENNFGTNSMTSGNLTGRFSMGNLGGSLSNEEEDNAYAPNISNWNVSNCTSFYQMFYGVNFSASDVDVSNWDFSSANSLASMFYRYNVYAKTRGTRLFNLQISTLTNSCTTLSSMLRQSTVTDIDFRGSDLSGITSFSHFWLSAYTLAGHVKRFIIDNNADLSSVSNMSNFNTGTLNSDDYSLLLRRLEATNNNTNVRLAAGSAKYDGGLIFPNQRYKSMTNSLTPNKVIDTTVDFTTLPVSIGDVAEIRRGNSYSYAKVTNITSTELTLDANVVLSGDSYNVQTSDTAKARYDLDVTQTWTITDGGPVVA